VAFSRWDPLRDLLALQEQLERFTVSGEATWTPPVDLFETPDQYVLTAEVAGLTREHVEIQVRDGQLVFRGQRPTSSVPCERYHRVERGHGAFAPFARRFALPAALDVDHITADLKDGVLTVTIPKAPAEIPRRIHVE
jgi:HSP20 family protein